jgi:hypothetical protein
MLCRCIRTSAQVRGASIVIPVLFVTKLVAEWLSADRTQPLVWSTTANNDVVYLKAQLQNPALFNEIATQPEWGTLYHGMKSVSGNCVTCNFKFPLIVDVGWQYHVQDRRGFYHS